MFFVAIAINSIIKKWIYYNNNLLKKPLKSASGCLSKICYFNEPSALKFINKFWYILIKKTHIFSNKIKSGIKNSLIILLLFSFFIFFYRQKHLINHIKALILFRFIIPYFFILFHFIISYFFILIHFSLITTLYFCFSFHFSHLLLLLTNKIYKL